MFELNKAYVVIQSTRDTRDKQQRESVIMVLHAVFGDSMFPVESTAQELKNNRDEQTCYFQMNRLDGDTKLVFPRDVFGEGP